MRITTLVMLALAVACGGGQSSTTNKPGGDDVKDTPVVAPKLCVDVESVKDGKFDIEALFVGEEAEEPPEAEDGPWREVLEKAILEDAANPDIDRAYQHAGGITAIIALCAEDQCFPALYRVEKGAVTKKIDLPGFDTIAIQTEPNVLFADWDGDGNKEIWLWYNIDSEAEAAAGVTTTSHLAGYSAQLDQVFHEVMGITPDSEYQEACVVTAYNKDVNCDNTPDLIFEEACGMAMCFPEGMDDDDDPEPECKDEKFETSRVAYVWTDGKYVVVK